MPLTTHNQFTKVGVGCLILKQKNQILLGKRKNAHGAGEYASAGGHLEYGETFEETALREIREEMGDELQIKNLRFLCITNLRKYQQHYIDIGLIADYVAGQPKLMEVDKVENWQWFDIDNLPKPLFASITNYIEAYKTGKIYFNN